MRVVLVSGEATLRSYFDLLPWLLLLLAPALSMKLLSDEYKSNTLEVLFAHPISELEIVMGKFAGAMMFYFCVLFTTVSLPLTLFIYSRPDMGQIIGQYIGALFLGGVFISAGIAASSYAKNTISSFLLGAAICFVLILIGIDVFTLMLPSPLSSLSADISVLTHTDNLAKGLLDFRDILYFVTVIGIFLTFAVMRLSERKIVEDTSEKRKLNLALILLIGIGFISNILLNSYPVRLDMTSSGIYTLSKGTVQSLKAVPDIVNITLYTSSDLPPQMQLISREVSDLLKNYEKINSKIRIKEIHPNSSPQASEDAQSAGIQEVTFNKIGTGKFEVQSGFLGLALRYREKTESIPFISQTDDIEYQTIRRIRKLTSDKEKTIGIYENSAYGQNQILSQLLSTQYKIENIGAGDQSKLKDISALVVIDDGSEVSSASAMIKKYMENNGQVLLLSNGVTIDQRSLAATKSKSTISDFLKDYGITINNDLVYDLQLNELLTFGSGNTRYLSPYPYWLKSLPQDSGFQPLTSVRSITLGWPSSIKVDEKPGISYKKLLSTSPNSGKTESNFNISPEAVKDLTKTGKEKILLAVSAQMNNSKLIVVGSTTLADDQFLQNSDDNVSFLSNSIDYLASDKDLAAIPKKSAGRAVFEFRSPSDVIIVQYGNLLLPPLLVTAFAFWYLRRRRSLTERVYEK